VFFLFNPFSERILSDFEEAVRGSGSRVFFYNFHGLEMFNNPAWRVQLITQTEPHWAQYRCAFITSVGDTQADADMTAGSPTAP
jgi:hypothetical protein